MRSFLDRTASPRVRRRPGRLSPVGTLGLWVQNVAANCSQVLVVSSPCVPGTSRSAL